MALKSRKEIDDEILDFSFYMIQRGETGHLKGCRTNQYTCSKGVLTIGYGTALEPGYNHINYPDKTITEKTAVFLARSEMKNKLYQKCRRVFSNTEERASYACFDSMLPCYQAVILDMAYQGKFGSEFIKAVRDGRMIDAMVIVRENDNEERAAVRSRGIAMGLHATVHHNTHPTQDPQVAARAIAENFITSYKAETKEQEITRDELALLYRTTMALYKQSVTKQDVENFANSFTDIAVGTQGIGDAKRLTGSDLKPTPKMQSYLVPKGHNNNPKDAFEKEEIPATKNKKKSYKVFKSKYASLKQGYAGLINRVVAVGFEKNKCKNLNCHEFWRAYTGVFEGVDGWELLERLKEKGIQIDENTDINLKNLQVVEALAFSISEINNGGVILGGKEEALKMIRAAVNQNAIFEEASYTARSSQKSETQVQPAPTPASEVIDLDDFKHSRSKGVSSKKQSSRPAVATESGYKETPPSAKNEFNNPGRICDRMGKPRHFKTLQEGYGKLAELLYENYNNKSIQDICKKFTAGKVSDTATLLQYMKALGVQVKGTQKLNLSDPKVLESLTISLAQLRQQGKIMGGLDYAKECVAQKIKDLQSTPDGVVITVQPASIGLTRQLADAGNVVLNQQQPIQTKRGGRTV